MSSEKDAYWFPHDANARSDPKLALLQMKGGQSAKGCWWDLVECLRESDGYEIPLEDLPGIEYACRFENGVIDLILECGLLIKTDTHIYSESLKTRMKKMDEVREQRRRAGRKGGKAKAKKAPSKTLAKPEQSSSGAKAKPEQSSSKALAKASYNSTGQESTEQKSTGEDKTGPDPSLAPTAPKPTSKKKPAKEKGRGIPTWEAYSEAMLSRYQAKPPRNQKTNAMCADLHDRLGADAPMVATWYVGSNDRFYCNSKHCLDLLKRDAEKMHMEWQRGEHTTSRQHNEVERLSEDGRQWQKIIAEQEAKNESETNRKVGSGT